MNEVTRRRILVGAAMATADKGGHRAKAIDLVKEAISEVEKGVEWAKKH